MEITRCKLTQTHLFNSFIDVTVHYGLQYGRKVQTTLILPQTHPHVGHDISQSQVPDQCVIVFFDEL